MLNFYYIFFLLHLSLQTDSTCTPYQCDSSSSSVSGCVRKDISSMKLTECKADYECTGQDLSTTDYDFGRCNLLTGKNLRSVNDYCYYEANCATQYCLNYACNVKDLGDSCTSDNQCSTFMKCFKDQCYERLHVGELCPTSGKELCRVLSQCVKLNEDYDYKCQALFSIAPGEKVTAALGETVDGTICTTGEIDTTTMTCYPSINQHKSFPLQCSSATDCAGSVSGTYSSCVCHYINNKGNKYCTPFPSERGSYLKDSKAKAVLNYSKCANWEHVLGSPSTCDVDISYDKYIADWIPTKQLRDSCYSSVNLTDYIYSEIPDVNPCPKFVCVEDSSTKMDYQNCIEYNLQEAIFYLKKCPEGYYCPKSALYIGASPKTIACVQNSQQMNAYNKICLRNSECYSNICDLTTYKCTYLEDNKACTTSYQCGQNSQCFSGICQKNLEINSTCNSANYKLCRPLSKCTFYSSIDHFSCQPLFQLNSTTSEFKIMLDGEKISSANIPFAYREIFNSMCESGYFNQTTKVCSDNVQKVAKGYPWVCNSDEDCVSSDTAEDGKCECEVNIYGNKYCAGFTADKIPNYFSLYHTFALKNLSRCFFYELIHENVGTTNGECNVGKFNYVKNVPEVAIGNCYAEVLGGEFKEEEEEEEGNGSSGNVTNETELNESKNMAEVVRAVVGLVGLVVGILF